jgi:hypothetical protein
MEYDEQAKKHSFNFTMTPARFQRLISQQSSALADDILAQSKEDEAQQETYRQLRHDIREENAEAWDYFDAVVFSMQQNGLIMLRRMDEVGEDDHSDPRTALSLIHSSATVTFCEIRALLLEGLWAGAAARWRSLHELTVTAVLVAGGGSEIARRYLDHGFVTQTERFVRFYDRHARGPLSVDKLRRRQNKSKLIIARSTLPNQHGSFKDQYGWALPLMPFDGKGKRKIPRFPELEKLAKLDNYRELVFTAHGLAHTDSGGVTAISLLGPGFYAMGPVNAFIPTVARPALLSVIHCIAATHLGFEKDINEFEQVLGLLAAGAMELASRGVSSFPLDDQPRIGGP